MEAKGLRVFLVVAGVGIKLREDASQGARGFLLVFNQDIKGIPNFPYIIIEGIRRTQLICYHKRQASMGFRNSPSN